MIREMLRSAGKLKIYALLLLVPILSSWGPFGHERINRAAVLALPANSLQTFFYNHIDFITQESTVPDLRKYTLNDNAEKPRHYIDLENFGPADSLPATLAEARTKYGEKFLQQNGILPWYIEEMMDKLTLAFKEKRKTEILFLAADLGHYLGDANMPLHTSANHDGQLTNQKGLHAFWESQLPEMFGDQYNLFIGEAVYIKDVPKETWRIIDATHALVDSILIADKELKQKIPADRVYLHDASENPVKNKFNAPVHSEEYAREFNLKLKGMIERQMRLAATATANFWYTAWVNAGKPELADLDPADQTERNKSNLQRELNLFKQGILTDIKSEIEF